MSSVKKAHKQPYFHERTQLLRPFKYQTPNQQMSNAFIQ